MAEAGLKRRIGLGLLTFYGVGVMIGAGIYVLVGHVAGETGGWAPLAFLVAGLVAAPTAVSYAELSVRIPESAGEAAYVRAATGSGSLAALIGLAVAMVGVVSAAAVLNGGVGYLRALVDVPPEMLATIIAVLLGGAAIIGVLESLAFAAVLTLIEVVGLFVVVGVGLSFPADLPPEPPLAMSGLAAGALLAFFAFIGFEDMVNMAEETRDPGRTMPRAIIAAMALTTLIYILVAWAAVRAVPSEALAQSERPLALVFETATARNAGFLAAIAVAAALNGVLAQIVMASRVLYGLGRFAPVFAIFHRAHPRFGTPVLATALCVVVVLALALTLPIAELAELTSTVLLAIFAAINLTLIVIKRRRRAEGFRAPVWVPWLGLVLSVAALAWGLLA
ncbi:MAG: APC family permease [Pseudomonadota bacterium]